MVNGEGKLLPKVLDLYRVVDKSTHVVVIDRNGEHDTVSLDCVTLTPAPPEVLTPVGQPRPLCKDPPVHWLILLRKETNRLRLIIDSLLLVRSLTPRLRAGKPARVPSRRHGCHLNRRTSMGTYPPEPDELETPPRRFSSFTNAPAPEHAYDHIGAYDPRKELYRVRWFQSNAEDDTYEPRSNLPHNLVVRFHRNRRIPLPPICPLNRGWETRLRLPSPQRRCQAVRVRFGDL